MGFKGESPKARLTLANPTEANLVFLFGPVQLWPVLSSGLNPLSPSSLFIFALFFPFRCPSPSPPLPPSPHQFLLNLAPLTCMMSITFFFVTGAFFSLFFFSFMFSFFFLFCFLFFLCFFSGGVGRGGPPKGGRPKIVLFFPSWGRESSRVFLVVFLKAGTSGCRVKAPFHFLSPFLFSFSFFLFLFLLFFCNFCDVLDFCQHFSVKINKKFLYSEKVVSFCTSQKTALPLFKGRNHLLLPICAPENVCLRPLADHGGLHAGASCGRARTMAALQSS